MDGSQEMDLGGAAPVNVSVPGTGTETNVIAKDRWELMHKLKAEGQTVSQIARVTGADRKTVRTCLARSQWEPYHREPASDTLLAPHLAWLEQRAVQVHFSARILFQELRRERGYTGSYGTVKNAVRPLRAEATVASLTQLRFETAPGEQAQVD